MPFKSEKQRKWMHANEPEMAKKWEKEETIEGKLRNLIKQEIKSINEGFDKYYLSSLLDSRLKKKLEIAIKNLKGKIDGVGDDWIWFRMPSHNLDLLAQLITKLDRNKNVWIGDKRKNNIWDRRQKINKLEAFRPKGVSHMNKIVFLPKSKLYFDPSNGNFWLMGPGGDPDWNDEPIEPKDRDYKRTLSRLSSKDKSIMKKSLRGSGNWKEATTSVSVPGYLSPKAFSKSTQNAIDVDDEDDEKNESINEGEAKPKKGDYVKTIFGIARIEKLRGSIAYMKLPNKKTMGIWLNDIKNLKPTDEKEKGKTLWTESINEDNIKFSKEEMAQLHKDGKIEKGGHTIEFGESVNEAIKPQGYSQLNRAARTLPSDIKDFLKALKKQDDDAVEREILYLKAEFDTFAHMLKDKKYTESVNEAPKDKEKIKDEHKKEFFGALKQMTKNIKKIHQYAKSNHWGMVSRFVDSGLVYDMRDVEREIEALIRMGESVNEAMTMAPFSSQEAKQHINQDIKKMSKHLGKASQQSIKIMMNGVKSGKYTAMDISRGIKEGPAGRTHFGELGFLQQLWNKVRDGFRRYSKDRKLS